MPELTLRSIPEDLHARLKAEAKRSFRSVNQEILYRLQRTFEADDARMTAVHAKWVHEAINSGKAEPLTDAEVDAALKRGADRAKARKRAVAA